MKNLFALLIEIFKEINDKTKENGKNMDRDNDLEKY